MKASNRSRTTRRAGVVALVAAAALSVPHPAAALVPIPPSPVRLPIAVVGHLVLTLAEEYAQAPTVDKRRLHHEVDKAERVLHTRDLRDRLRRSEVRGGMRLSSR